jgi:hypothetical protein
MFRPHAMRWKRRPWSSDSAVLVDLAVNLPPEFPASVAEAGPTLAPEELADHKLLALFDRVAARDFRQTRSAAVTLLPAPTRSAPSGSYLATATRHGISWLDALTRAAEGSPWIPETG